MHNQIKTYLSEVEHSLRLLPKARRIEELCEMRQHLQNAMTVYQEQGQSEDEAAQSAIVQFGSPDALGQNIVYAWRHGQILQRRNLWGAASCTVILYLLIPLLLGPLVLPYLAHNVRPFQLERSKTLFEIYSLSIYALAGLFSGLAFPKRAVAGAGLAILVLSIASLLEGAVIAYIYNDQAAQRLDIIIINLQRAFSAEGLYYITSSVVVVTLAAWVGSRERRSQARMTVLRP